MRAKIDYSHGKCRLLTRARLDANSMILFASSLLLCGPRRDDRSH